MGRKSGKRLPNSSRLRLTAIAERSASDPERPKMTPETELRLQQIEVESAACYANMEDATHRFYMIAQVIENETDPENVPSEVDEEISTFHHLEELSIQLKAGVGD